MSWFTRKSKGDGKALRPVSTPASQACLVSDHDGCHNPLDWTSMPSHLKEQFPHWKEQSYPSPSLRRVGTETQQSTNTKTFSGTIPDNAIPYVVMENDTLVSIALKFDTKPGEIARLNKKPTVGNFPIMPGQVLYIPDTPIPQDHEATEARPAAIPQNIVDSSTVTTSSSGSHDEELWQAEEKEVKDDKPLPSDEWKIEEEVCDDHIYVAAKFMSDEFCIKGSLLINPQSIMFQPNPLDPLVEEHGAAPYEVLVPHSEIVHAYIKSVYSTPDGCLLSPMSPLSPTEPSTPPPPTPPLIKSTINPPPQSENPSLNDNPSNPPLNESPNNPPFIDISAISENIPPSDSHPAYDYPPLNDYSAHTENGSINCNGINISGNDSSSDVPEQNTSYDDQQANGQVDLDCLHKIVGEDETASSKSSFDEIKSKDTEMPHSPWYFFYIRVSQSSQQNFNAPVVGIEIPLKNKLVTVRTWFVFAIPSNRWEVIQNFLVAHHPLCDSGLNKPLRKTGAICEIINIGGHFSDDSLLITESHFSSWEIFSVRDFEPPRIEMLHVENSLPLPTLTAPSELLNEICLRKLSLNVINAAVSHDWCLVYSTFNDGISLQTLYRKMIDFEDSPTLLLIQDSHKKIFGAMVPCALRISERFYGTGDSFLFSFDEQDNLSMYHWTGSNDYIVKGSPDSIAFGSGDGHFGLWLDESLLHGNSTHCTTFNNKCLATQEKFIIHGVEAWGFV